MSNFHQIVNTPLSFSIPVSDELQEHAQLVKSNKNLLSVLGEYWHDHYQDYSTLKHLVGATEALFSTSFKDALHAVLGSNIIDVPASKVVNFRVLVFNSLKAVRIGSAENPVRIEYSLDEFGTGVNKSGINFITSNVLNPRLVLTHGENYDYTLDVAENKILFYVDIFEDQAIKEHCLRHKVEATDLIQEHTIVLLWGLETTLITRDIWKRYGHLSGTGISEQDSENYKHLIAALQYYFTNKKSVNNTQNAINIIAGIPFSKSIGETVLSISLLDGTGEPIPDPSVEVLQQDEALAETQDEIPFYEYTYHVVTTHNEYTLPFGVTVDVHVNQTLDPYQLLGHLYNAEDYLTNPDWYKFTKFPAQLLRDIDFEELQEIAPYYKNLSLAHYNSEKHFNGSIKFWNAYKYFRAVSPENNGNVLEVKLYNILDKFLKYNLVHFYGDVSYSSYTAVDMFYAVMSELYKVIQKGFPLYLYPIFNFNFKARFADLYPYVDIIEAPVEPTQGVLGPKYWSPDPYQHCIKYNETLKYNSENNLHFCDVGYNYNEGVGNHDGKITYNYYITQSYDNTGAAREFWTDQYPMLVKYDGSISYGNANNQYNQMSISDELIILVKSKKNTHNNLYVYDAEIIYGAI